MVNAERGSERTTCRTYSWERYNTLELTHVIILLQVLGLQGLKSASETKMKLTLQSGHEVSFMIIT